MAQTAFPFAPTTAPALAAAAASAAPGARRRPQPVRLALGLARPAAAEPAARRDDPGHQIGWDHARHRLTPPLAHLQAESPVRQGWTAGRAAFGARTRAASPAVQQWLALRLEAWQHCQVFEEVQVTPHLIARLEATHCPVTRQPLLRADAAPARANDALLQRLNPSAAYAAGNLAQLSRGAAQARAGQDFAALQAQAQRVADAGPGHTVRGLDAAAWQRLATLASLATPLPHAQAACLPLRALPPNRVRVVNPVQALQVVLTLQFTEAGYARRLLGLAALMPSSDARQAFQIFMHTLLARRLGAGRDLDALAERQAMEDTWADPLVNRRWQRLALRLSPAECEQLLQRAQSRGLCVGGSRWLSSARATDGWALAAA